MLPAGQFVAGSGTAVARGAGDAAGVGLVAADGPADAGAATPGGADAGGAGATAGSVAEADVVGSSAAVGWSESGPPPRKSRTASSSTRTASTARTDIRRRQKTWACAFSDGYLRNSRHIVGAMLGPSRR